jgi:hypothetical protein
MNHFIVAIFFALIFASPSSWAAKPRAKDASAAPALATADQAYCLSIKDGLDKMCARDAKTDDKCSSKQLLSWFKDSCVNPTGKEVISEIVNLRDKDVIPPEIFQKYPAEKIGRSLVYRDFQNRTRKQMTDDDLIHMKSDPYHDLLITMAFSDVLSAEIFKHGFLNQHQIPGHTNGWDNPQGRAQYEDTFLNVTIEKEYSTNSPMRLENLVRPKYSFLLSLENFPSVRSTTIAQYGNSFAVFKDEVKKRSTWTSEDSLVLAVKDRFAIQNFYLPMEKIPSFKGPGYSEAQIWGPATLADVKYFLVGCYGNQIDNLLTAAEAYRVANKLDKFPVPIYSCMIEQASDITILKPVQLLAGQASTNPEDFKVSLPKQPSLIRIASATFGGNINGVAKDNALKAAGDFCNTKTSCEYKVSTKYLGDPAAGKDKDFDITWTCTNETPMKPRQKHIAPKEQDTPFKISCEDAK